MRVETFESDWQTQAEMNYNALGQRLEMDASGITSRYVMNGNQPLSATTGGNTTFYLYGLGPIGELTTNWSYSLPDGTGTSRQVTDASGTVTFAATYTPWGDTFESFGEGSFTWDYFGGLMDTATGLLYVGNGQYYDPSTGRFLTRSANPNSTNPYVPWNGDPSGAFLGPLALLALVFGNKRKRGKWDVFVIVLVLGLSLGLGLVACGGNGGSTQPQPTAIPDSNPAPETTPGTGTTTGAGTDAGSLQTVVVSPVTTPIPYVCPTPDTANASTPTPTSTNTPGVLYNEDWEGIVNVLWYEGASSFSDDQTEIVFRKELWALRSEGKYDPSLYGWTYSQIVQSSRYSANAHFGDQTHYWPAHYVSIAQQILSDQLPAPSEFDREAIYFISTTHFLRRAPQDLNNGTPTELVRSGQIPTCDSEWCAFPDIRWRDTLYSISVAREEDFIPLFPGNYQLHYKEHYQNEYEECYWIGLYFNNIDNHMMVFNAGNDQSFPALTEADPPGSPRANELKCPSR